MKDGIDFVARGLQQRRFDTTLCTISFGGGWVQTFNGAVTCQAPVSLDIVFTTDSQMLLQAFKTCDYAPTLKLSPKTVLITGKGVSIRLPCIPNTAKKITPQGTQFKIKGLRDLCTVLKPFISEDASRRWSQALLFKGGYAFATNNIALIRKKYTAPDITLPGEAVTFILKHKEEPSSLYIDENLITIKYEDGKLLQIPGVAEAWPALDTIYKDFPKKLKKIPSSFCDVFEKVSPFATDDVFQVDKGSVTVTHATAECASFSPCKVAISTLAKVLPLAVKYKVVDESRLFFQGTHGVDIVMAQVWGGKE